LCDLPATAHKFAELERRCTEDLKKCTDVDLGLRIEFEREMIRKEWMNELQSKVSQPDLQLALPFEIHSEAKLHPVRIKLDPTYLNRNSIGLTFELDLNKTEESGIPDEIPQLFFYASDQNDRCIPGSLAQTMPNLPDKSTPAGFESLAGILSPLEDLDRFSKIVIIAAEEYDVLLNGKQPLSLRKRI